jgi:hypothetical protein
MHVPCNLHPHISFVAQLTNHSPHGFDAQTKKPSQLFCGPNRETRASGFEAKPGETVATGFEAKPGQTIATGFQGKPGEIIDTDFEAKSGETIDLDSEAKSRNMRSSSPCA